jgi:hypothetical protein
MEGMIQDKELSREYDVLFMSYLQVQNKTLPFQFGCQVLRMGCWPSLDKVDVKLPADAAFACELFSAFYKDHRKHSRLDYVHSLGEVVLSAHFPKCGERKISMKPDQAILALLFNDRDSVTVHDASALTGLPEDLVKRHLDAMSKARHKFLTEEPSSTFRFNESFISKERKFTVPVGRTKGEKLERELVQQEVEGDRKYQIRAKLVRIMKARQTLRFNDLVSELIEQSVPMFKPDLKVVKLQIEYLLEHEYLERNAQELDVLTYRA